MNEDFQNRGDHGRTAVPRPTSIEPRIHTNASSEEKLDKLRVFANWFDSLTGSKLGSWVDTLNAKFPKKKR